MHIYGYFTVYSGSLLSLVPVKIASGDKFKVYGIWCSYNVTLDVAKEYAFARFSRTLIFYEYGDDDNKLIIVNNNSSVRNLSPW